MKPAIHPTRHLLPALLLGSLLGGSVPSAAENETAQGWRRDRLLIDLHQHIAYERKAMKRAVDIMDAAGVGLGVNLSGGTVTRADGKRSAFERNKALADALHPGRFLHYMNLDYSGWDDPGWSERAVRQVEEGHRLGAAGLKEWKRLGLYLRDKNGALIKIDDPKLDPVWKRCGELGLPISIHVADPKAFWLPYNQQNERWTELKDHKSWWFGDPEQYPPREALLAARNRVIERHPETLFVCVHFANNPEDIEAVDGWLDRYPNMRVDLAARVPELGRHDPRKVHELFIKHQDRILFATDFMVYNRLILGSGGSGPGPSDAEAVRFYQKHWRWLETWDQDFEHMTPIQGDWTISGIGLPEVVLRKIYFGNARKLLGHALPTPSLRASRAAGPMRLDGRLDEEAWTRARPVVLSHQSLDGTARPKMATPVKSVWTEEHLYLGFHCPFTTLTVFEQAEAGRERMGLWERDVVEAFIGSDPRRGQAYDEFEVAPTGEKLDVRIRPSEKDFGWESGFEAAVEIEAEKGYWVCEMRIPLRELAGTPPRPGTQWRLNLYRCDRANEAYLAWIPTLRRTFHVPDRFGYLVFE